MGLGIPVALGIDQPMKAHPMNDYQAAVALRYGGGEFAHLIADAQWRQHLPECGDTLFAFLMLELSAEEGCASRHEALRRLRMAAVDLLSAVDAITQLPASDGLPVSGTTFTSQ